MNKSFFAVIACLSLTVGATLPTATIAVSPQAQQAQQQQRQRATNYRQYMQLGYAANKQRDYQAALQNFRLALQNRPRDPYATRAIRNVESYIRREEAIERQRIEREQRAQALSQQLQQANTAGDWRCAAETVEQLIPLFPANSLKRAELVAYRSQLQGLLSDGANINRWSTVCLTRGV